MPGFNKFELSFVAALNSLVKSFLELPIEKPVDVRGERLPVEKTAPLFKPKLFECA